MIWLIVLISINGGPQRAIEEIPYADLQSCEAEKVVREGRVALHSVPHIASIFVCRDSSWPTRIF
jgi:hypothetical protein